MHERQPLEADEAGDAAAAVGDLAEELSDFARAAERQDDLHDTLTTIVLAAVELVPGADDASVTVVLDRARVTSEAASGDLPRTLDALQERSRQGPCLDAVYEQQTVCVPDLAAESRWPDFTADAVAAGAAGMLAFQLYVDGDNLGALNLYSRQAGAFDEESEHVGGLFAAHAAVAYSAARTQSGLERSVATRQVIGQAQGILIERHKITSDQAFAMLVRASQHHNVKLRDLAETLVETGALPA